MTKQEAEGAAGCVGCCFILGGLSLACWLLGGPIGWWLLVALLLLIGLALLS